MDKYTIRYKKPTPESRGFDVTPSMASIFFKKRSLQIIIAYTFRVKCPIVFFLENCLFLSISTKCIAVEFYKQILRNDILMSCKISQLYTL